MSFCPLKVLDEGSRLIDFGLRILRDRSLDFGARGSLVGDQFLFKIRVAFPAPRPVAEMRMRFGKRFDYRVASSLEMLPVVRLKRFAAKDTAASRAKAQILFNAARFTLLLIGACNLHFRRVQAVFFLDGFVGHRRGRPAEHLQFRGGVCSYEIRFNFVLLRGIIAGNDCAGCFGCA